jgi:hypothetical protein
VNAPGSSTEIRTSILAAVDQFVTLDHVQLVSMGRAIIVDESLGRDRDRIDDKRVAALIMTD